MKKITFGIIASLVMYLIFELMALAAYTFSFDEYKLYDIQNSKLSAISAKASPDVFTQGEFDGKDVLVKPILHPYVGFYIDGKRRKPNCQSEDPKICFTRIKVPSDKPLEKRAPNKLIVGILGGSFADGTARQGEQTFIRELSNSDHFKGYEIVIYNLANGAYKQPQQLMHLAFYYSLGAEFDIIINIDGFNELAASYYNYRDAGIHPTFPVSWNHRLSSSINKEYLDLYSDRKQAKDRHAQLASYWLIEGFRYSPIMNFIWRIIDQKHINQINEINSLITKSGKTDNRDFAYEAVGPDFQFTTWPNFFSSVIEVWLNSSLAINAMAEGQGAEYYHFLQPNQYIRGSKTLSEWEKENAVIAEGGYGNVYRQYYSSLAKTSNGLLKNNVNYYDLTYIFKNNSATLYVDNCCHLNGKGYDIVAREIVATILSRQNLTE